MSRSPMRVLLIITFMCSLIYAIQYNFDYILIADAIQTSQLPGLKITSHAQNQQVPAGILSIWGTSTDNSTTDCNVYIILNEMKPYQRVTPIGNNTTEENHDYSTWNYTFTPDYATIQEGNNRMVSKIACIDHSNINIENLTKFNSLNVTGISTNNLEQEIPRPELPTNTTNSDLVQLQQLDSTNANSVDAVSNQLQDANAQDDKQDHEEDNVSTESEDQKDDSDNNGGADYSSGREVEEEEEVDKDFVEELHDRVLDQVRERLSESGIHLPE